MDPKQVSDTEQTYVRKRPFRHHSARAAGDILQNNVLLKMITFTYKF